MGFGFRSSCFRALGCRSLSKLSACQAGRFRSLRLHLKALLLVTLNRFALDTAPLSNSWIVFVLQ